MARPTTDRKVSAQALERNGAGVVRANGARSCAVSTASTVRVAPQPNGVCAGGLGLVSPDPATALNHRCVWLLKTIAAEPGLSNKELAERVGILGKSHISRLLACLRQRGLIANTQEDPTPAVPNAWVLTGAGLELERAIRDETPGAGEMSGPRSSPARGRSGAREFAGSVNGTADPRREGILAAAVRVTCREGARPVSLEQVVRAAGVSRETFDEFFEDFDACVLAAFDQVLVQALDRAGPAFEAQDGWLDRVRAGLLALLEFLDQHPPLARFLVVHSAEAGPVLRARRSDVLTRLVSVLDNERAPARHYPPPLTAEGVLTGVLGVLHGRLTKREPGPLIELLNPLMSFIVLPYLGARAARRELARPVRAVAAPVERRAAVVLLQGVSGRAVRDQRAVRVLGVVAAAPGLSNAQVAERAGVKDQGHISRLLTRLARLGLIENRLAVKGLPVAPNVWHLTSSGEEFQRALQQKRTASNGRGASPNGAVSITAPEQRSRC